MISDHSRLNPSRHLNSLSALDIYPHLPRLQVSENSCYKKNWGRMWVAGCTAIRTKKSLSFGMKFTSYLSSNQSRCSHPCHRGHCNWGPLGCHLPVLGKAFPRKLGRARSRALGWCPPAWTTSGMLQYPHKAIKPMLRRFPRICKHLFWSLLMDEREWFNSDTTASIWKLQICNARANVPTDQLALASLQALSTEGHTRSLETVTLITRV